MLLRLFLFVLLLIPLPASAIVMIDWVTLGDPGNACDVQSQGCFGAVAESYRIGKFEVTNRQYVEFLNAVAATDTFELYDTNMTSFGGITRSGSSGSFVYSLIEGGELWPVNSVTFWDVVRFANWLHNGQPVGVQDNATTEDGAYTLLGGTKTPSNRLTLVHNEGATIFIPSENEWYKAAYYSAISSVYNPYPFADGFDGVLCQIDPGTTSHSANCANVVGLTDVGAYPNSVGPNGTFDQGGNSTEWTETIAEPTFGSRIIRGGERGFNGGFLAASTRAGASNSGDTIARGFRVASPVPPVPSLTPFAVTVLGTLMGLVGYRRLRA